MSNLLEGIFNIFKKMAFWNFSPSRGVHLNDVRALACTLFSNHPQLCNIIEEIWPTALKMDDIKKAPCGQAPLCSSESNMSNHVRMSFVLLITVANQKIWALEIFGFSGVRKWYKNVCKTAIFQAKRLIFCVNTYFLILSTSINSVYWFLKNILTDTSFEKY